MLRMEEETWSTVRTLHVHFLQKSIWEIDNKQREAFHKGS